ncbi:histidine kinase [Methylomarinum vadi]|uniref:histidine kinase n=1 Tax=Methylomarinum vadi TaxID=438855 RepID=UPI0004DF6D72|nr:histidine kinase [Methylomarinum vadi]
MRSKSLRFQITYRVLLFAVGIMVIGGAVAIWQARNAVEDEVESSINLALQLVKLGFSASPNPNIDATDWISRLSALKQTRHLNIQLQDDSGNLIDIAGGRESSEQDETPPRWFADLVGGDYPKVEYRIETHDNKVLTLVIQANPLDEITEVWGETRAFFLTICLLVLLIFMAVHLVFNKTLQAIETIVDALKLIETGEYRKKLPEFATQEYDSIAGAINHMTDVLERTRQKNRALTQHSLQIQEEERQRLSQELHDELGQSLTAIKVMAATAAHRGADTPKITQSITEICDHLIKVVRSMMQQLHPLILSELGLKATLEDLVEHWAERNPALSVELDCDDAVDTLDHAVTIQLFRVIQECLTNINRHAHASRVTITLAIDPARPGQLAVKVVDDGEGCHIEHVAAGFGLLGMKERIKSLDGEFSFHSRPGAGMTVEASVPIA